MGFVQHLLFKCVSCWLWENILLCNCHYLQLLKNAFGHHLHKLINEVDFHLPPRCKRFELNYEQVWTSGRFVSDMGILTCCYCRNHCIIEFGREMSSSKVTFREGYLQPLGLFCAFGLQWAVWTTQGNWGIKNWRSHGPNILESSILFLLHAACIQ